MAFPSYVLTRTVSVGGAAILESSDPLRIRLTITASKSLINAETGYRFKNSRFVTTSEAGTDAVAVLPRTDMAGWKDARTGDIIDVTAEGSYTHQYIALVEYLTADGDSAGISPDTIGPFIVPAGDGVIDLDKLIPVGSSSGESISFPAYWDELVQQAQASAAAAQAALLDSADFIGSEIARSGSPAEQALLPKIADVVDDALGDFDGGANQLIFIYHGDNPNVPRGSEEGRRAWVGTVGPAAFAHGIDILLIPQEGGGTLPKPTPPAVDATNLMARWSALDPTLALNHNDPVTAWSALAGSAGASFTVAGSPTFKSDGGAYWVETDGVDDILSYTMARAQPFTMVFVGKTFTGAAGAVLAGAPTANPANSTIAISAGGAFYVYAGNGGAPVSAVSGDTDWHVFVATFNGSTSELRMDGAVVVSGNAGTNTSGGVRHGASSTASLFYRLGIRESIHYSGTKTLAEKQAIEASLMTAYGIS